MDMTKLKRMAAKRHPTCQWCGTELHSSRRGRPRKYCSQACRQRAYEQRNAIAGTQIPAEAIILRPEDLVTEMKEVKHYFQKGIMARKGIEK